jgi:hypothetical protein
MQKGSRPAMQKENRPARTQGFGETKNRGMTVVERIQF